MLSDEEYLEAEDNDIFIGQTEDEEQNNRTPAPNVGGQVYLVPRFTGLDDVSIDQFIEMTDLAASLTTWTPVQTFHVAKLRLGGAAADHVRACSTKITSWETMKKELKLRFKPRIPRHVLELKLASCTQRKGETVSEYATRLRLIGRQISQVLLDTGIEGNVAASEAVAERIFHTFLNGLRKEIKRFVLVQRPTSLDEAIDYAIIEEATMESTYRPYESDATVAAVRAEVATGLQDAATPDRPSTSTGAIRRIPQNNNTTVMQNQSPVNMQQQAQQTQVRTSNNSNSNGSFREPRYQHRGYPLNQDNSRQRYQGEPLNSATGPQFQYGPNTRSPATNNQPGARSGNPRRVRPIYCYDCGSNQHLAHDCPLVICGLCNNRGHKPAKCSSRQQTLKNGRRSDQQ